MDPERSANRTPATRSNCRHEGSRRRAERLVEDRSEPLLVQSPLLLERPRREDHRRVEAVQTDERMARSEEIPRQAMAIEIACEDADAATAERATLVPIGARRGIEFGAQAPIVDVEIRAGVGAAEEAEESW